MPEGPAMVGLASDILETLMADEVEAVLTAEVLDIAGLGASKGGTGGRRRVTVGLLAPDCCFAMWSRSSVSIV